MNNNITPIAQKFHRLTELAIRNGGLWCWAGNNTEKTIAKIIATETGVPFRTVIETLNMTRPNWHDEIQYRMTRTKLVYDHDLGYWRYRFHISDIARVAVKSILS